MKNSVEWVSLLNNPDLSQINDYYLLERKEVLPFIPLNVKTILDIGCSGGLFGKQLIERQNAEVWGIEPNEQAFNHAKHNLTHVINDCFSDKLDLPKNYFDCVVFNDVLEHLVDPWQAIKITKQYLKVNNSFLVASIPNFRYCNNMYEIVISKKWDYKEEGILDRTHLRFFTKKSIPSLVHGTGFNSIKISGINPSKNKLFRLMNFITANQIEDMRYLQFVLTAKY